MCSSDLLAALSDLDYKELGLLLHNGGRKGYAWHPRDSLAYLGAFMSSDNCKQAVAATKHLMMLE